MKIKAALEKVTLQMTIYFLLKFIIDIMHAKKKKLYCAFIDYRKAFDCVWREGLWHKLLLSNINGKILTVVKNLYKGVKSCICNGGGKSDFFLSLKGVRQGENLSPLLFSLFVNGIEDFLLQHNCVNIDLHDETLNMYLKLFVLMYADDTLIMANSPENLQHALDCV